MTGHIKTIGITGGIGSGKSAVTNRLRELGYPVIDADEVSREAALPREPAMIILRKKLGDDIFLEDGNLDRPALAKLIFNDPEVLKIVNKVLHKDILRRIESKKQRLIDNGERMIFISAPLLFEASADEMTDEVWLVTTDEDIRLKRVKERDGISESDIRLRMKNQMPEAEKRKRADIIIENNGTLDDLYESIKSLLK